MTVMTATPHGATTVTVTTTPHGTTTVTVTPKLQVLPFNVSRGVFFKGPRS